MMDEKRRILIVDDEVNILFILCEAIARLGNNIEVLSAHNGQEALLIMRSTPIDILITDLVMPEIDGIVLTKVVYAIFPKTRVIWITSSNLYEIEAKNLMVDCRLTKPFDLATIRRIVCEKLAIPFLTS